MIRKSYGISILFGGAVALMPMSVDAQYVSKIKIIEPDTVVNDGLDDVFEVVKENMVEQKKIEPVNPADISRANNEIYVAVDQAAQFPGGQGALMKWLAYEIMYPVEAAEKDIQGRVVVQFVVEKDGTITNPKIARGVDPYLDKEALRVIRKMPKWIPATKDGQVVRSYFNLPVTFRLMPQNKETEKVGKDPDNS